MSDQMGLFLVSGTASYPEVRLIRTESPEQAVVMWRDAEEQEMRRSLELDENEPIGILSLLVEIIDQTGLGVLTPVERRYYLIDGNSVKRT